MGEVGSERRKEVASKGRREGRKERIREGGNEKEGVGEGRIGREERIKNK